MYKKFLPHWAFEISCYVGGFFMRISKLRRRVCVKQSVTTLNLNIMCDIMLKMSQIKSISKDINYYQVNLNIQGILEICWKSTLPANNRTLECVSNVH